MRKQRELELDEHVAKVGQRLQLQLLRVLLLRVLVLVLVLVLR